MIVTILAFILVFGLVVLAHELGHFLLAKKFGVKIEEFAVGIPPKIFARKIKGITYALNLIPIGGYVKLYGEDGQKDSNPENLMNKKYWQRSAIFAAGVTFNIIFAYILLTLFYAFGGQTILMGMWEHKGVENTQKVVITDVEKDSPAESQGILPGDTILSVNGENVYLHQSVFGIIQTDDDRKVAVTIERNGEVIDKELETYRDTIKVDDEEIEAERTGVVVETQGKIKSKWYLAPIVAGSELVRIIKLSFVGIWDFVKTLATTFKVSENVGGPVAIAQLTGAAAKLGFAALVQIVIILNIILGVFNILPFPALDGGHIAILGIEKVTRKEIPERVKAIINFAGFALLLLLVAVVTWGDLGRLGIFN